MKSGLELEIRQSFLYVIFLLGFFFLTGYFFLFAYLLMWIIATLEELDPEEVESEEELWPFLEFTYIETNWKKGKFFINMEIEKEINDKKEVIISNIKTDWFMRRVINKQKKLNNPNKNDVLILNEIGILQSVYI